MLRAPEDALSHGRRRRGRRPGVVEPVFGVEPHALEPVHGRADEPRRGVRVRGILARGRGIDPRPGAADSFVAPKPSRGLGPARSLLRRRCPPPPTTPRARKTVLVFSIPSSSPCSRPSSPTMSSNRSPMRLRLGRPGVPTPVRARSQPRALRRRRRAQRRHLPVIHAEDVPSHRNSGASSTSSGHGAPSPSTPSPAATSTGPSARRS